MSDLHKSSSAVKQVLGTKPAPLGRGLSALFGDADSGYQPQAPKAAPIAERGQKQLPVTQLQPGAFQPRRHFDETALGELAASVKEHGILQPLLVRPVAGNRFEIIAGERRWRAAQRAGLHEVPVVIRDFADADALEIALIENIQRQDLSPLEEAEGYKRLIEEFTHTQEGLAKVVGKSRSHVANMMRLLGLPDSVKKLLEEGALSMGHARALLTAENPEKLARAIIDEGMTVRDIEARMRKPQPAGKAGAKPMPSADLLALEKEVTNLLGLKVKIATGAGHSGHVTIQFRDLDQLENLLQKLRS